MYKIHVLAQFLVVKVFLDTRYLIMHCQVILLATIGFIGVVQGGGALVKVQPVRLGGKDSLALEQEKGIELG